MIQVVYGKKGSGKTKRILAMANAMVDSQHGNVVFVDDDNRYMFDLRHEVRFVNAGEFHIENADMLFGFLCGMLSQNFDIKVVFFDAFLKLVKTDITKTAWFFQRLEEVCKAHDLEIIISIGMAGEDLPDFIHPYFI